MRKSFELHKVSRFLATHGQDYTFKKFPLDKFKEPLKDSPTTVSIRGVYHEDQGYVTVSGTEGATLRTKPSSLMLCSIEDSKRLERGMTVEVGGSTYTISELRDINKAQIACDISLELILDG